MDRLGIARLAAAVGGSLGGMQAMQWTLSLPGARAPLPSPSRPRPAFPPRTSPSTRWRARRSSPTPTSTAATSTPHNASRPGACARAHARPHHLPVRRPARWSKFGRVLQARRRRLHTHDIEFQIESYLRHQGDKFSAVLRRQHLPADHQARSTTSTRPRSAGGDLARAFCRSRAPRSSSPRFSTDWRFPPERSREIVKALADNRDGRHLRRDRRAARPRRVPARRCALPRRRAPPTWTTSRRTRARGPGAPRSPRPSRSPAR